MSQPNDLNEEFQKEIRALQAKYPMCYIESWNPNDWQQYLTPERVEEEDEHLLSADWHEPIHCEIAAHLTRYFDAQHGTDWNRLEYSVDQIKGRS